MSLDPRGEAQAIVGAGAHALVLEPSPPAVDDEWFADDPTALPGGVETVLSPVPGPGRTTWDDWLADHPEHRDWAAQRWLGAFRNLTEPPNDLAQTRATLHQLQYHVLTQARFDANGKIGLRWTRGGCGTPFFGDTVQLRLDRDGLHVQHDDHGHVHPVTTLADAWAAVAGVPEAPWDAQLHVRDTVAPADPDAALPFDGDAMAWLGDWYGFAWSLLEQLRHDPATVDPSRPQLWPEHQDPAIEIGSDEAKRRASVGFSPGDGDHPEPYVYIAAWYGDELPQSDLWNATTFAGAILPVSAIVASDDHRASAWSWLVQHRDLLQRP